MKLIQKLKIWKELKRLETRVRQSPSPSVFVDLGQVYINLGMHDKTLTLADEGLALFPDSNELRKLRRFAKKNRLSERVRELKALIAKAPSPGHYGDLANLYLELGDFDAVLGTCKECIRQFPDHDGAYVSLARAYLTNFYRDLNATDGLEAVRNLQKAIALRGDEPKPHKLLAELLHRIGAVTLALHHLEVLRSLGAIDGEVDAMYEQARNQPSGGQEDLEGLFHRVEAAGAFANAPVIQDRLARTSSNVDPTLARVRESLAHIAEFEGVRKAAYIKGSKALVKGDIRDGKDTFLRVTRVVAKAAQRASRRMDIGTFNKGVVEGTFGHIYLCSYGDVLAAVQGDGRANTERLLDELQELVASSLYTGNEESR